MNQYKTSSWYVDSDGIAHTPTIKFHDDKFEAERQYHLFCAAAATSEYPLHVALLELVDGTQLKREFYVHTPITPDEG